jgi:two-component system phosphate regulon sensor histidine kinase PhoR
MPSPSELLVLWKAADGAGQALDGASVRALIGAFLACASVALLLGAVLAALAVRAVRRRVPAKAVGAAGPRESCEELASRLEEMVRKTNERNNYINSIFATIEDGLLLADVANRIVLYNPRAESLLGLGPWVFFETSRPAGRDREEADAVLALCGQVTQSRVPVRRELRNARGRLIDAHIVPVADKYRNSEDFGSLAILRDVTEVRKLEALRKDFVATVSHEFRTPLTLISGFMEMLLTRESMKPADRKRALEIVEIETERLKRLVSELLTLSEIENSLPGGHDEAIDVGELVESVAASLGPLARKKGQELAAESELSGPPLRGNANWLWQAITNLVENAIKYTPEGGSIGIRAWTEAGELKVAVRDTGIGIEKAELERIFERFYRVEKSRGSGAGGSGLGLALVKDIAAILGGRIEVESLPGAGSTFTLRFNLPAGGHDGSND